MADYGLRIKNALGTVLLDTSDRITRFRYNTTANAGVSDSIELSDISGILSVEFSVGLEKNLLKAQHGVSRSSNTISWTASSGTEYTSMDSLIFVFLYT